MSERSKGIVTANAWTDLRQVTSARIALGRSGVSIPTGPHLAFQLAHARARNAVHHELDGAALVAALRAQGHEVIELHSAATNRAEYLQRPDKGRRLDEASQAKLSAVAAARSDACDVAIVIGDGLSAFAIEKHAAAFLAVAKPAMRAHGWRIGPVSVVRQARVAVGDEIGHILGAELVVVLIGERPGLSSPDSLGIYMTFGPSPGLTDEARNCISNVRAEGLSYAQGAHKLDYLMREAMRRGHSGVHLKDEAEPVPAALAAPNAG